MALTVFKWVLGIGMIGAGLNHFLAPKAYTSMMPKYLPAPRALVLVSGVFEMLGGAGLLVPQTQRLAAWGLIALYIAVFPANVNMAIHNVSPRGMATIPHWVLWARLPIQLLFIWWAWLYT